jgi:hypothetical protein
MEERDKMEDESEIPGNNIKKLSSGKIIWGKAKRKKKARERDRMKYRKMQRERMSGDKERMSGDKEREERGRGRYKDKKRDELI